MKNLKLFFLMLLSLVGMAAVAQTPTLKSTLATPVTSLDANTDYLIAAGTDLKPYYFNVNGAKTQTPTDAQIFTCEKSGSKCYLQRKSDDKYVCVEKNWLVFSLSYKYSLSTNSSPQNLTFGNNNSACSIYANDRYIVSNGDNNSSANLSENQSYDWYFYKAAVVNITYRDVTNGVDLNTITYCGRVGDVLTMPAIDGYTVVSGSGEYKVNGNANVTINYNNDNGEIGKLANGRYYMRSNASTTKCISSLKSIVTVVDDARSFWSVWNVTKNSDGTYTIVNEGNNKVMTPCTDPEAAKLATDDGYLYYDTAKKGYFVGTITDSKTQFTEMTVEYNSSWKAYTIRSAKAGEGYYMAVDGDNNKSKDENGVLLQSDGCVKSINGNLATSVGEKGKNYHRWTFSPVVDNEELYDKGVEQLNAYVGGLTTMDRTLPRLNELNELWKVIDKYDTDKQNITADNAATKYQEFVEAINAMRQNANTSMFVQSLVPGRPFYVETIGDRAAYGNRMYYEADNKWSNGASSNTGGAYTFYVTSYPGSYKVMDPATGKYVEADECFTMRTGETTPHYLSRMEENPKYNDVQWDKLNNSATTWEDRIKDDNYKLHVPSNVYIGTTTNSEAPLLLKFIIVPIVPGIYQMCDTEDAYGGDPFLTFNGEPFLNHYRVSEIYSYFRFKTYNSYEYVLGSAGVDANNKEIFAGTYGKLMHTQIDDTNVKAYYVRAGKYTYNEDGSINSKEPTALEANDYGVKWDGGSGFTVYLDILPNNIIQATQGAVLIGTSFDKNKEHEGKIITGNNIKENSANDVGENNMLHAAYNSITIETSTWGNYYDYFVLSYKGTNEVIGTWNGGQPVYGCGLGFYHVKRGSYIPAGKCYLSTADLNEQLLKRYPETWNIRYLIPYPEANAPARAAANGDDNVVAGFRLVFRDAQGEVTGIEEAPIIEVEDEDSLDALTTLYSLDGRQVTAPRKGEVYILNGKKVMF